MFGPCDSCDAIGPFAALRLEAVSLDEIGPPPPELAIVAGSKALRPVGGICRKCLLQMASQ